MVAPADVMTISYVASAPASSPAPAAACGALPLAALVALLTILCTQLYADKMITHRSELRHNVTGRV
jgi:hypothetical protein